MSPSDLPATGMRAARRAIDGAATRDRGRLLGLLSRWQAHPDDLAARDAFSEKLAASIATRERIVRPLLTVQQYALFRLKELNDSENTDEKLIATYEKLVTRSLFGNTNASRNSA